MRRYRSAAVGLSLSCIVALTLGGCATPGPVGPKTTVELFLAAARKNDVRAMYDLLESDATPTGLAQFDAAWNSPRTKPRWTGGRLAPSDFRIFLPGLSEASFKRAEVTGREATVVVELKYAKDSASVFVVDATIARSVPYRGIRPIHLHSVGEGPLGPRYRDDPGLTEGAPWEGGSVNLKAYPLRTVNVEFHLREDIVRSHWKIAEMVQPYGEIVSKPLNLNDKMMSNFALYDGSEFAAGPRRNSDASLPALGRWRGVRLELGQVKTPLAHSWIEFQAESVCVMRLETDELHGFYIRESATSGRIRTEGPGTSHVSEAGELKWDDPMFGKPPERRVQRLLAYTIGEEGVEPFHVIGDTLVCEDSPYKTIFVKER